MKKFISILFISFIYQFSFSQQIKTVVDGSLTDHDHVFEEYYHYSHVQYIYDKTLIGQSGTITDIQFEHNSSVCTTNNITIYMGGTTDASFTGSSDWINSGMTLVYSGSVTPSNGWYNINIADFYYDNTYNLAIIIDNDDGSYCGSSSYLHYYAAQTTYTMLRDRGSSDVGDYGSISSVGTRQMELASLQLVFLNTSMCSGTPAGGTATATVTSGCAVFNTTLNVVPTITDAGISFQWQSSTDNVNWTNMPGATTQSYTTAVTNTTYYRRVTTCTSSGLSGYSSSVQVIADCFNMSSGTVYTCTGHFYDSGGPSANYGNSETRVMTMCSGSPSEYIKFVFSSFYTSATDILEVFDGTSTAAPLIYRLHGQGSGNDMPPDIISTDSCITFRFTSDASTNYAGWDALISCTTEPNTVAHDFCGGATHICRLNGYTGKTSSFYDKDFPGNMCDVDEGTQPCTIFNGNINNNSWVTFTASSTSATFDVTVSNCSQNQGIQLGIYSGSACDNFALLSNPALTEGALGVPTALPNNTTTTVSAPFGAAPSLIPGQTYYIMIDGQSGDVCNYSILATSGVAQASVDISDTTVCSGVPVTLTASGGTNYTWSTTPPTSGPVLNLNNLNSDSYVVTITGGNPMCPDQAEVTANVNVNPRPNGTANPMTQSICSGQAISNIGFTGDIPGTTFSWTRNNPAGITTAIPLSGAGLPSGGIISGNTLTNSTSNPIVVEFYIVPTAPTTCNGATDTVRITVNPLPTATVTAYTNPTGCGSANGTITVTSNGAYSYLWNTTPAQTTNAATGLASGSHQVTVSIGGCAITLEQSLSDPGSPTVGLTANDNSICNGENIIFTASGITSGTYEFFVDGTSVQGPNASNSFSSTSLTNGQIITVSGIQAGCQGSGPSIPVTVTGIPVASINPASQFLCSNENSNAIIVNINAANSHFDWTVSSTSGLITTLPNGGNNVASGGSIDAYSFINSGTTPVTIDITITPTTISTSTCTGNAVTAQITVNPLPVPSSITTNDVTVCAQPWNGGVSITNTTGLSPFTYSLDNGSFITDNVFYGLNAGNHDLTIQDANSCSFDTAFTIGTNTGAFIDSTLINNVSCFGLNNGVCVIYSADAATYQIDGFSVQTDSVFQGIAAGTYTIHIWDAGSCEATQSITITQPQTLTDSIFIISPILCHGNAEGVAGLIPEGGTSPYYYQWDNATLSTTQNISGLTGDATYSVTVTDNNGCSLTDNILLSEPTELISILSTYNIRCFGGNNGAASMDANGGTPPYSYLWTDPSGSVLDTASGMIAGTQYYVSLTDDNGCIKTDSFTLTQPVALSSATSTQNISCFGLNDGSIQLIISGGTAPYTYIWSGLPGESTNLADSLMAGIAYSVTTTDSLGCQIVTSATLTQPAILSHTLNVSNISCNGFSNGTVTITPAGGTPPYSYTWENAGNTTGNSADSLLANVTYGVTVSDSHGCADSASVTLTEPELITGVFTTENVSCFGSNDGTAEITIYGGTTPYSYLWNTGDTLALITELTAAPNYTVTLTDALNCVLIDSVSISQPDALVIADSVGNGVSGFIEMSVSGGTPIYSFNWSNGSTTEDLTGLATGIYSVTITDENGCSFTSSFDVFADILIPNAITPNSDGINDDFEILNIGIYQNVTVEIFSRWGDQIFLFQGSGAEYAMPATRWKGENLPMGSYLYIVKIEDKEPYVGAVIVKY